MIQDLNLDVLFIDDNEGMLTMPAIIRRGKGYRVTARKKLTILKLRLQLFYQD
jgi:hypothetical protein